MKYLAPLVLLFLTLSCHNSGLKNFRPRTKLTSPFHNVVTIKVLCAVEGYGYGSGLKISPRHILTAAHVVDCEMPFLPPEKIVIGTKLYKITKINNASDLAIIELADDSTFKSNERLSFGGPPGVGEMVCAVTAMPKHGITCGEVGEFRHEPKGDVEFSGVIQPGNSGSPVFDGDGKIVGVVTHYFGCNNGQYCGGRFTSLWGRQGFFDLGE